MSKSKTTGGWLALLASTIATAAQERTSVPAWVTPALWAVTAIIGSLAWWDKYAHLRDQKARAVKGGLGAIVILFLCATLAYWTWPPQSPELFLYEKFAGEAGGIDGQPPVKLVRLTVLSGVPHRITPCIDTPETLFQPTISFHFPTDIAVEGKDWKKHFSGDTIQWSWTLNAEIHPSSCASPSEPLWFKTTRPFQLVYGVGARGVTSGDIAPVAKLVDIALRSPTP